MNRTLKLSLLLLFALTLAACGGAGAPADEEPAGGEPGEEESAAEEIPTEVSSLCANEYFPVVEGASWTYSLQSDVSETFSFTSTVAGVREDGFTYNTDFPQEGDLSTSQEWSCQSDGLQALEFGGGAAASLSVSGNTATYTTSGVTGVTLPSAIASGDSWSSSLNIEGTQTIEDLVVQTSGTVTINYTAVGIESVTVPAGMFDAMRVDTQTVFDLTGSMAGVELPISFTSMGQMWWAPGVGWVKTAENADFMGTAVNSTTELTSYTIP